MLNLITALIISSIVTDVNPHISSKHQYKRYYQRLTKYALYDKIKQNISLQIGDSYETRSVNIQICSYYLDSIFARFVYMSVIF